MLDRSDVVARYDSNPERHDHFFCTRCGRAFDFEIQQLPTIIAQVAGGLGKIEHVEARVQGVCKDCLNNERINDSADFG